jgi:hypothetical protein
MVELKVRSIRTIRRRAALTTLTAAAAAAAGLLQGTRRAAAASGDYMRPDASRLRSLAGHQRPNFLCVGAPYGGAALALFTQAARDKCKLAERTEGAFKENSFLGDPDFPVSDVGDPANKVGLYSDAGNFVPTLQKRGAVFLGCHNAIWELATALLKAGGNPDRLTHEGLAADLTNSLIPGVISTPGNEAVIGKFQVLGFVYSYS